MIFDDFINRNNRGVVAKEYTPDDAPQKSCVRIDFDTAYSLVPISTLPIGQTFFLQAYPKTHPGQFFWFELDSISFDGVICPWISDTGRFLINSQEDTLCFSVISNTEEVYICNGHTEEMKESFGNPMRNSWDSTLSGCSLTSTNIMDPVEIVGELKGKIERQDDKLEEIAQQMRFLIEFAETALKKEAFPPAP